MQVRTVDSQHDWNAYAISFGAHPMQAWEWGQLKVETGPWSAVRLAVSDDDGDVGGAQVLVRRMPFPFRAICYLPRGPLAAPGRLMEVADAVAGWCRDHTRAVSVKVDPAVTELAFTDGWVPSERVLINRTATIDLTPGEDAIMAAIPNRKCRQYIRKAERDGVAVRLGTEADLGGIYALYQATAKADGFPIHEAGFYRRALSTLGGLQQLLVAERDGILHAFLWNIATPRGTAFELWGAVSEEGRRSRANYYLKWCAIRAARTCGATLYDLNGLLNDGISDFKLLFVREPTTWVDTHDRPLSPLYHAMDKALEIRRHRNTRDNAQADTSRQ